MGSFGVFIIGIPGQLRSSSLQNWVSNQSSFEVRFVDPVIAKFEDAPFFLKTYLTMHYAHKLTDGEWGCAIAHQRAQSLAKQLGLKHALFLEDDAEVESDFTKALTDALVKAVSVSHAPAVVHGYNYEAYVTRANGITEGLSTLVVTPIYAIAYIMNQAALEMSIAASYKSFPVGKADFPSWSASTAWFGLTNPLAMGHDTQSSVVGDRPIASRQTGLFWQLLLVSFRFVLTAIPTPVRRDRVKWELKQFILGSRLTRMMLKLK
jgi:GR25 family glycosyltransferase involved in LPS biosynthesis